MKKLKMMGMLHEKTIYIFLQVVQFFFCWVVVMVLLCFGALGRRKKLLGKSSKKKNFKKKHTYDYYYLLLYITNQKLQSYNNIVDKHKKFSKQETPKTKNSLITIPRPFFITVKTNNTQHKLQKPNYGIYLSSSPPTPTTISSSSRTHISLTTSSKCIG
jgi:hypothetical protein